MLKDYIKWLLFLSSYTPFYLILLIFVWGVNWYLFYTLIGFTVILIIILIIVLKILNSFEKTFIKVKKVDQKNDEFVNYIFTYILPFLSYNFLDIKYIISLIILFLLIGFLYVKANLIYTNPLLNLFGYNLYEIEDQNKNIMILITKIKCIKKEMNIKIINIGKNIYLGE